MVPMHPMRPMHPARRTPAVCLPTLPDSTGRHAGAATVARCLVALLCILTLFAGEPSRRALASTPESVTPAGRGASIRAAATQEDEERRVIIQLEAPPPPWHSGRSSRQTAARRCRLSSAPISKHSTPSSTPALTSPRRWPALRRWPPIAGPSTGWPCASARLGRRPDGAPGHPRRAGSI